MSDNSFDEPSSSQNPLVSEQGIKDLVLKIAREALSRGEVPVGCVIALPNDHLNSSDETSSYLVIGRGVNRPNETKNATRHAEFEAIDEALEWCRKNGKNFEYLTENVFFYGKIIKTVFFQRNPPQIVPLRQRWAVCHVCRGVDSAENPAIDYRLPERAIWRPGFGFGRARQMELYNDQSWNWIRRPAGDFVAEDFLCRRKPKCAWAQAEKWQKSGVKDYLREFYLIVW